MKILIIMLIAACGSASAIAQEPNSHEQPDYLVSRWVIDVNLLGGLGTQTFTTTNSAANYPGGLNMNTGQLKYNNGTSFGGDAQLGFFFGKMRHFGLGTGFMYMAQSGDVTLSDYHAEYQATDGNNNIYRQVVTGNNIKEVIHASNMSIPLVLKYKTRFDKHWGFSADAGALINLHFQNTSTTHASFNYEAIYKLEHTSDGGTVSVYDNSPIASTGDWFVTKAEFLKNNPDGNYQSYVDAERAAGINVGNGLTPNSTKSTTTYSMGSIGLLVQPSINYYLSDYLALNLGVYYMLQPFTNSAPDNYRLESGIGTYSSVLNNVKASNDQQYGINFGARFFFRKNNHVGLKITSIDPVSPSLCGLCDGGFTLHGLPPGEPVLVEYNINGGPVSSSTTTVQPDGLVKVTQLCAGSYSGIKATVDRKSAAGTVVVITDPSLNITSQKATNPTAPGASDGSVRLTGLVAGGVATVEYNLDGTPQTSITAVVNSDNSITISELKEGHYTGMRASMGNCSAVAADFTLSVPVPAPLPAPVAEQEEPFDLTTPLLFDFNKSSIHVSSYPLLNEASKELIEEKDMYIRVDAYTDAIGSDAYNQKLSERRAKSVKTYLKNKGANPARIKVYGHGEAEPAASNETDEGRSKNRRAVMHRTSGGK